MDSHAPENYKCPICIAVSGTENEDTLIKQSDIVYRDDLVTAFISSFFIGKNGGHPIIVPNEHFENIYDLSDEIAARIFSVAKKIAVAVRNTYDCEGITTVQNNEPVGGQHAFHYHFHIFPRYKNDDLHAHMSDKRSTTAEERLPFADMLKRYLKSTEI